MNINTGQGMSLTDFSAVLGLTTPDGVPQTPVNEVWHPATLVAPPPVQQRPTARRPRPEVTREWHDRLIALDDAAKGRQRVRQVPVKETRVAPHHAPAREAHPAANVNSTPSELIKQAAQKTIRDELRREKASYYYREPVTMTEWLNGADGRYRTPFRNL